MGSCICNLLHLAMGAVTASPSMNALSGSGKETCVVVVAQGCERLPTLPTPVPSRRSVRAWSQRPGRTVGGPDGEPGGPLPDVRRLPAFAGSRPSAYSKNCRTITRNSGSRSGKVSSSSGPSMRCVPSASKTWAEGRSGPGPGRPGLPPRDTRRLWRAPGATGHRATGPRRPIRAQPGVRFGEFAGR